MTLFHQPPPPVTKEEIADQFAKWIASLYCARVKIEIYRADYDQFTVEIDRRHRRTPGE